MRAISLGSVLVVFVCIYVFATSVVGDDSPVLYFTFDEGKGGTVKDQSSYKNDGIILGNPKWVGGKFGSALEFDGDGDTVEVKHNDSLNMTTAVTMEMWVKVPPVGGLVNQVGIEKGTWDAAGEYSLYPVYEVGDGTLVQFNDLPDGCDDENAGRRIRDNAWHHLAGVWDGKTIFLYIDGEVDRSSQCAGKLGTTTQKLYIASRMGSSRFLVGTVDEVRVYNRALTREEIREDMETLGSAYVSPSGTLAVCWGKVKQEH